MRYSRTKQDKGTFDGDRSIERNKTNAFKSELILAYDNACAICGEYAGDNYDNTFLEAHHIKRVSDGGKTCYENMVLLCPTCHEKAHKGIISYTELHRHTIDKSVVLSKLQNRMNKFRTISENKTLKQDDLFERFERKRKTESKTLKQDGFIIQRHTVSREWATIYNCISNKIAMEHFMKYISENPQYEVRLIQTNTEEQA